jgi:hypothetical protein
MNCCLTAQIRFMHFKGPGSFKIFLKICENIDEYKGHRLVPLTPPLFFHFTLPLMTNFRAHHRTAAILLKPF